LDKKTLSEADICEKFIAPAIQQAGWNTVEQIYREYTLWPGWVVLRGNQSHHNAPYGDFYTFGNRL
jgi:type I restriction enzyme R subunit